MHNTQSPHVPHWSFVVLCSVVSNALYIMLDAAIGDAPVCEVLPVEGESSEERADEDADDDWEDCQLRRTLYWMMDTHCIR
jgi:hypothetical protein